MLTLIYFIRKVASMKKILSFMDWGIFALRSYHYILLLSRLFAEGMSSNHERLYVIWLLAAFIVPMIFWFPGQRMNKAWFCIMELLLGGSYYVNSVFHPALFILVSTLIIAAAGGYFFQWASAPEVPFWHLPLAQL
ncbi:hypothetical protein [Paenibacillus sp. NEAU-GSW1]|uniref:hypothetical protein n=1 Tax=Paenibacillus sp. NEAU-GSW1 TaxID=2682486 RepID=UPI0020A63BAD|nr:hypothetical protein [Paenibacillus sp. NEAU-GSW1]